MSFSNILFDYRNVIDTGKITPWKVNTITPVESKRRDLEQETDWMFNIYFYLHPTR